MPDIALRFNKDMLTLSTPVQNALARQGVDVDADLEYQLLMEPEAIVDAIRLEAAAGVQCLVVPTEGITAACLSHKRMEGKAHDLAHAACVCANEVKPQHVIAAIGPSGLPSILRRRRRSTRTARNTSTLPGHSRARRSTPSFLMASRARKT